MSGEPHEHPQVIKVGRQKSIFSSGIQMRFKTGGEQYSNRLAAIEVGMVASGEVLTVAQIGLGVLGRKRRYAGSLLGRLTAAVHHGTGRH